MSKPFLRLCPWCFSDSAELEYTDTGFSHAAWVVICKRCGAHGPHASNGDDEYAVERWNEGGVRGEGHEGWSAP